MDTNKFDPTKYGAKQVTAFDPVKMGAKPVTETSLDGFANATPGYFQRVGEQYKQAGESIVGGIKQGAEMINKGNLLGGVRAGLRTVGGVAGAAFAPILEAPVIKPLTEKVVERATQIPGVNEFVSGASNLAKKYPNASADIKNIIDIATLGGGKAVEAPLAKEVGLIGKDVVSGTKFVFTPSEASIQNKVVDLFNKSIKPTAKKTIGQGDKYENDVLNALKTIKNNANDLNIEDATGEIVSRTPQTIQELAQGVDQTKKLVFTQYDNLAKQAGTQGAVIEAMPIADEVAKVAQNKALQLTNPEVIKYAENWSDRLRAMGTLDTETTQEVVKLMNNNLQSFYRNPTYDTASKVAVDAGIANNFRAALDKAIEGATGKEYQALKNQYSALKAIENDVVRAAMRDARKNVKGLLDYTDMFTGGQMIGGILSLNPAMFTKGAIERGFKEYIKFLNDPNRAINNIFEKLKTEVAQPFKPQSSTGQYLKNPKMGMGIEDVSNDLIAEARKYKSAEEFVKAQGKPVFHGTNVKFNSFDKAKLGVSTKAKSAEKGFWFVDNEDVARGYGEYASEKPIRDILDQIKVEERRGNWDKVDELTVKSEEMSAKYSDPVIIQANLNLKNPMIYEAKGKGFLATDKKVNYLIDKAIKNGNDGLIIKNLRDNVYSSDIPATHTIVFNDKSILTKSQLTDIWKKANAGNKIDPLINEAKKYKSAEEFVKAKQVKDSQYYTEQINKIKSQPKTFGIDNKPVIDVLKKSLEKVKQSELQKIKEITQSPVLSETQIKAIKEATTFDELWDIIKNENQDFIGMWTTKLQNAFPKDVNRMTKSQLTDIWNKANQSAPEQTLLNEARKYKSAEEFVKAQEGGIKHAQTGKPVTARLYHGSPDARFAEEFDPMKTGYYKDAPDLLPDMREWESLYGKPSQGFRAESTLGEKGVSFTDSRATAKSYSEKPAFDTQNSVPMILERYVTLKNPKVYDMGGKKWNLNMEQEMRKALENGHDGLVFKNILDDYHPFNSKTPANNIIALDTNAIKTRSQLTDIWNKANKK